MCSVRAVVKPCALKSITMTTIRGIKGKSRLSLNEREIESRSNPFKGEPVLQRDRFDGALRK